MKYLPLQSPHLSLTFYSDLLVYGDFLQSEFMCGILELTSGGGIFGFKDLGGEICFKDCQNVTAFSSYGVRELISSFNPYLRLLCLLYSCGKR